MLELDKCNVTCMRVVVIKLKHAESPLCSFNPQNIGHRTFR